MADCSAVLPLRPPSGRGRRDKPIVRSGTCREGPASALFRSDGKKLLGSEAVGAKYLLRMPPMGGAVGLDGVES